MFRIRVTHTSGCSAIGECDTEEEARKAVSAATLRMLAGQDGITDVTAWEDTGHVRQIAADALVTAKQLWAREDCDPAHIIGYLEASLKAIISELGTGA